MDESSAVPVLAEQAPPPETGGEIEVIVKFHGTLTHIAEALGAEAEILSQSYAILTLFPQRLSALYAYPEIEDLELPKSLYIETQYSLIASCVRPVQDSGAYGLTGRGVLVGIIDSGVDYTHPDFRSEDGRSRILCLWDQTGRGTPPAGFAAGAEYTQARLNEALASPDPFSVVPDTDPNGHGTAVAGIAAGNGRSSDGANAGAAPEASLIVVRIGKRGFRSFAATTELMRAVKYVIDRAREFGMPVAINMSFGMNNGSHRGDSLFETYLTAMSMEWKNVLVAPTGNEGAAGHHYAGRVASNETQEVEFFTASGIERFYLSLWKNFADSFSVELVFPGGGSSGVIGIESQVRRIRMGEMFLTVIYGQPSHYSGGQEILFDLRADEGKTVRPGLWKLRVIAGAVVDGAFAAWLPTLEEVTEKTRFSSPTATGTMTIPSTAAKLVAVSGYSGRLGSIAEFSGVGNSNQALPNPDVAAPCVGILTTRAGGGYDTYTGTSLAAPFVTGSAALMMQWGIAEKNDPFLYGERLQAFLRLGARREAGTAYPNPLFGYGRLCLENSMQYLSRYQWGGDDRWLRI